MATSMLGSKGRTTIPKAVRERLGLRTGDRMEFVVENDVVVLRALTKDIRDLKGMLPKPKHPVSLTEMDRALRSQGRPLARG